MNTMLTRSSRTVGPRDNYTEGFRLPRPALVIARFTYLLSMKVAMFLGRLGAISSPGAGGSTGKSAGFSAQAMADDLKGQCQCEYENTLP
jgi:hypothetical protein